MTLESALLFALALLLWVFIPGPAILTIVGRSLAAGFKPTLSLIAGILLGDLFYILIALFGLAAMGRILGDFFVFVRIAGGCYLVYLGLRLWFSNANFVEAAHAAQKGDRFRSFLAGFSITLGNPKAIAFHLGFLPTFFDLATIDLVDAMLIIVIFMTILGLSLTGYAFAASKARWFFRGPRRLRLLNRSAGTILIGAGIAVATRK